MELILIIFALILIASVAFCFKVYLQDRLDGKSFPLPLLVFLRRIPGSKYVYPINKNKYHQTQHQLVKTANTALTIFWICFILVIMLGAVNLLLKTPQHNLE
jgi:hypothetical protein